MSIDLSEKIGLPIALNDQNMLEMDAGVAMDGMSERKFSDLAIVAADSELKLPKTAAYYMYRNVRRPEDEVTITKHNQRFDLTVIPAAQLGDEYIKTSGHYHPLKPNTSVEYPELYYVAHGQATYLLQKHEKDGRISDVILARVKAGEAIIMPPFYGHVTINETDETLVMANWVEKNFSSVYGDYELKRGGAYYLIKHEEGASLIPNVEYGMLPEARILRSEQAVFGDLSGLPIYDFKDQLGKIELISNPESHIEEFDTGRLFGL